MALRQARGNVAEPARVDPRPRGRRLLGPITASAGVLVAGALLYAVDPNEPGHYPMCPTRWLFGIDCPGCGVLRATHALLHGDVPAALDHNALLPLYLGAAAWFAARWYRAAWRGRHPAVTTAQARGRTMVLIASMVVIVVFGVVRNLVPYLSSSA